MITSQQHCNMGPVFECPVLAQGSPTKVSTSCTYQAGKTHKRWGPHMRQRGAVGSGANLSTIAQFNWSGCLPHRNVGSASSQVSRKAGNQPLYGEGSDLEVGSIKTPWATWVSLLTLLESITLVGNCELVHITCLSPYPVSKSHVGGEYVCPAQHLLSPVRYCSPLCGTWPCIYGTHGWTFLSLSCGFPCSSVWLCALSMCPKPGSTWFSGSVWCFWLRASFSFGFLQCVHLIPCLSISLY